MMGRVVIYVERAAFLADSGAEGADSMLRLLPAPGALPALRRLSASRFGIVIIDSGARGGAAAERRPGDDDFLRELLTSQGVPTAEFRACGHDSAASCDCAFPGLGLVRADLVGNELDRARSAFIAATADGLALAGNMGIRAIPTNGVDACGWEQIAHELLDAPRRGTVLRKTRETDVRVAVDLDVREEPEIATGIGFFDHMLEQLGKHGGFSLHVTCRGDLEVDEHHTVEDVALALGEALRKALGPKLGVARYGFVLPMDEASAQVSIDLSGRPYFVFDGQFRRQTVGGLPTELVPHFFRSLSDTLAATLHISLRGENDHHLIEACFKGFARAFRQAIARDGEDLPTTKGTL